MGGCALLAARNTKEGEEEPAASPTEQRRSDAFRLSASGAAGSQLSVMSAML